MSYVDITPDTSIVTAWSNQLPQWITILGELVDNAFDADASRVVITLERDRLRIDDNGRGCANLQDMLTAGRNARHPTTRLGRYGIGFKQAVSSAGKLLQVVSVHQGLLRQATVDWEHLARSGRWGVDLPEAVATPADPGTSIIISHLRNRHGLSKAQIASLVTGLCDQYAPALERGRQLAFVSNGQTTLLQALQPPELEHSRSLELLVGRKKAYIRLGLVPEGQSYRHSGLAVSYGFRVIQRGVRWGLGPEPTPGLVGRIDLLDGWNLSTNKERVLDDDLEHLEKQIAERCADVIARAVQRGYSVPLDEANDMMAGMWHRLQAAPVPRKARRASPTTPTGTVPPHQTLRRHRKAARVQPGQTLLHPRTAHGITISLNRLGLDGALFRYLEGGIMELNLDNRMIAAIRMQQSVLACIAVMGLAATMIVQPERQQGFFSLLQSAEDNAAEQIAELANRMFNSLPDLGDLEEA